MFQHDASSSEDIGEAIELLFLFFFFLEASNNHLCVNELGGSDVTGYFIIRRRSYRKNARCDKMLPRLMGTNDRSGVSSISS